MKNKNLLLTLLVSAFFALILSLSVIQFIGTGKDTFQTASVAVRSVGNEISADGSIHSANEAVLHFQTGGKLIYLPYKEGDQVYSGQAVASLDTYQLQKQLQATANTFASSKISADQTLESNQAGVLEGQQRASLDTTNKNAYNSLTESQVITDNVQRIVAQSNLSLSTASLNVQIAQYAIQLATITAPFTGIITHEDVTVPNINITPETSFSIADPTNKVFRANILASDIDFVSVGAPATINLDGKNRITTGTVSKVYPDKTTVNGQATYQVDIQADGLTNESFGQTGNVQIQSNTQNTVLLIPYWTVVGHNTVWVVGNGKPTKKMVTIGKTHGTMIEILHGLSVTDKVITNPDTIAKTTYKML